MSFGASSTSSRPAGWIWRGSAIGRDDLTRRGRPGRRAACRAFSSRSKRAMTMPSARSSAPSAGSSADVFDDDDRERAETSKARDSHRLFRLVLLGLARALLSAGLPDPSLVRALRQPFQNRRAQRAVLLLAQAIDGALLGAAGAAIVRLQHQGEPPHHA